MSLAYISSYYGVPAARGQRVEYADGVRPARQGAIVGAKNQYIRIKFDGDKKPFRGVFHPTSDMRYLTGEPTSGAGAENTPDQRAANHGHQ